MKCDFVVGRLSPRLETRTIKECGSHFGAYLEARFPWRKVHLFFVGRACNTVH